MPEHSLVIEVFKIAPGIAGAVAIAYFAFVKIEKITQNFLTHIEKADERHALHLKAEQDRFMEGQDRFMETLKDMLNKFKV